MTVRVVGVAFVVHLEAERVLKEVAGLLRHKAGHDYSTRTDVHDLERPSLRQHAGDVVYVFSGGDTVGGGAQFELAHGADVAEFTDADVAVVVR